jgi:K+-transporting ATPase KdpF subunit
LSISDCRPLLNEFLAPLGAIRNSFLISFSLGCRGSEGDAPGMGVYFLGLVVLLTFVYLFYALFRPEKF